MTLPAGLRPSAGVPIRKRAMRRQQRVSGSATAIVRIALRDAVREPVKLRKIGQIGAKPTRCVCPLHDE